MKEPKIKIKAGREIKKKKNKSNIYKK